MNNFDTKHIRKTILKMSYSGSTAHLGCALSIVEILCVLYRNHLDLQGKQPKDPDRNYLVLSKGHGVMTLYACLYELGWISQLELSNYFKNGTRLKGLGDAHIPGVEVTAGSLGHGLSVGVGLALAAKLKGTCQKCYVIVGDGELNEGSIWEAILFSAHHKLDNLCVIIDENRFQAMGSTQEVMDLGNLQEKFNSFNFDSCFINGHDENEIDSNIEKLMKDTNNKPKVIVARTIKGKGISFMENDNSWHYRRLSQELYNSALNELV